MAASTRFYFMSVLLVAVLFISFQGAFGQSKQNENCSTTVSTCTKINVDIIIFARDPVDKEVLCKAVDTFLNCMENLMKQCGHGEDVTTRAKEDMAKYMYICSASRLPAVSALCLLMTALFHMIL